MYRFGKINIVDVFLRFNLLKLKDRSGEEIDVVKMIVEESIFVVLIVKEVERVLEEDFELISVRYYI